MSIIYIIIWNSSYDLTFNSNIYGCFCVYLCVMYVYNLQIIAKYDVFIKDMI